MWQPGGITSEHVSAAKEQLGRKPRSIHEGTVLLIRSLAARRGDIRRLPRRTKRELPSTRNREPITSARSRAARYLSRQCRAWSFL